MIRRDIYNKIKSIVDGYRQSGVSALGIKKYFSSRRNFKDLVSSLSTTQWDLEKRQPDVDFENLVREILFDRILQDRIYYERDNPITENKISKLYLEKLAIKTDSVEEAMEICNILREEGYKTESQDIIKSHQNNNPYVVLYRDTITLAWNSWVEKHFKIVISYKEFMDYYNNAKNFKRISNPEIDPFGEEHWGYEEEMNENKNEDWTEINFRDLINKFGIEKSIELLNNYCVYKRVIYVNDNGVKIYLGKSDFFTTLSFLYNNGNIMVKMTDGGFGIPKSLIFVDKIPNILNNIRRIKNLKDDPFGEEHWGYEEEVNESIENMDLTKYFITYNNVEEMIEIAKFLIKNKYRVYNYYDIIDSVVSEWDGYHFDGEEFLRCSDGFAQYRTPINLYELKSMLSRKKIKNIEKDPFGEEFWGYEKEMNENKNEDWTEINFRDLINKFGIGKSIELLNNYCVYKRVIYVADSGEKVYLGSRDGYFTTQHFQFTVGNNIKVNMVRGGSGIPKSLIFVDKIPNILCGLKRVRNLKVDPFDEENWGYEEEE